MGSLPWQRAVLGRGVPGRLLAPENKQFQTLSLALNFPFLGLQYSSLAGPHCVPLCCIDARHASLLHLKLIQFIAHSGSFDFRCPPRSSFLVPRCLLHSSSRSDLLLKPDF